MPLEDSALYTCPKCEGQFEAFTFAKAVQCPFCLETFERVSEKHRGQRGVSEKLVVMFKQR